MFGYGIHYNLTTFCVFDAFSKQSIAKRKVFEKI